MNSQRKNQVLRSLANLLDEEKQKILEISAQEVEAYTGSDESMRDRLKVDPSKIEGMKKSLLEVADQDDPVGKVLYDVTREDGLHVTNKTVPFGTILIIYESRPDVTIEAAATAFKAGNHILLKGGKESARLNMFLTELWQKALEENGFEKEFVQYLNFSRAETQALIKENTHDIDIIIPRGGEGLIRFVTENASVPVIISGRGNNFMYVDEAADPDLAIKLMINGKKRISVCNALDKVLFNRSLPDLSERIKDYRKQLNEKGIEVLGDDEVTGIDTEIQGTKDKDILYEEFLAPKIYFSLVDGLKDAVKTINHYSGGHSSVVVTEDKEVADEFMNTVDTAATYHNASTRFTDGGQYGVGAEIAISTQKLHHRGPVCAQELVTNKWFVYGTGQIRE